MTEEINPLETREPIGVIDAFKEGSSLFFKNITSVLKMSKPVLGCTIALYFAASPVIFNKAPLLLTLICSIVGLCFFIYYFWKYIIGYMSVSYLAKDIYENKEIQEPSKYFGYVSKYSSSYIKFWLWAFLIIFGAIIGVFAASFILIFSSSLISAVNPVASFGLIIISFLAIIALSVFLIPFYNGIFISPLSWAYGDKTNPLERIFEAIKLSYKNALPLFGLLIVLSISSVILVIIPTLLICLINTLIFGIGIASTLSTNILTEGLGFFISYYIIFVATRYYFGLIKK